MAKSPRLSEADFAAVMANQRSHTAAALTQKQAESVLRKQAARDRFHALGRLPKGTMNKTEAAYAALLDVDKAAGRIVDWKFHPMNVRLAANTFYEVDFLVLDADLRISIHEVKGEYTTDKGQMKIKLCAEALPWFKFLKVTKLSLKNGGGWKIEEY